MSTPNHSHTSTCRCPLHQGIEARKADCYRQLARTILGPIPVRTDVELARALQQHAQSVAAVGNIVPLRPRRAA